VKNAAALLLQSYDGENDNSNIFKGQNTCACLAFTFLALQILVRCYKKDKCAQLDRHRHQFGPVNSSTFRGTNRLSYSHRLLCLAPLQAHELVFSSFAKKTAKESPSASLVVQQTHLLLNPALPIGNLPDHHSEYSLRHDVSNGIPNLLQRRCQGTR